MAVTPAPAPLPSSAPFPDSGRMTRLWIRTPVTSGWPSWWTMTRAGLTIRSCRFWSSVWTIVSQGCPSLPLSNRRAPVRCMSTWAGGAPCTPSPRPLCLDLIDDLKDPIS